MPGNRKLRLLDPYIRKDEEEIEKERKAGKCVIVIERVSRGNEYLKWLEENIGLVCR